jgi:hypothetical protein
MSQVQIVDDLQPEAQKCRSLDVEFCLNRRPCVGASLVWMPGSAGRLSSGRPKEVPGAFSQMKWTER